MRGCACRGPSAGICHLSCLLKFAEAQVVDDDYLKALQSCAQCQQGFRGKVRLALCRAAWLHFADRRGDTDGHLSEALAELASALTEVAKEVEEKTIEMVDQAK